MASIFTRIIRGELPGHVVAETDDFVALLDIHPMTEGHTLCIPKREVDYYFDLTPEELSGLTLFGQRVARALEEVIDCERIAVGVLGLEVPHAHVHLVPVRTERDFRFGKSVRVSPERMEEIATTVRAAFPRH